MSEPMGEPMGFDHEDGEALRLFKRNEDFLNWVCKRGQHGQSSFAIVSEQ